jgi:hypothetical protein
MLAAPSVPPPGTKRAFLPGIKTAPSRLVSLTVVIGGSRSRRGALPRTWPRAKVRAAVEKTKYSAASKSKRMKSPVDRRGTKWAAISS